jgi:hypothetical protein
MTPGVIVYGTPSQESGDTEKLDIAKLGKIFVVFEKAQVVIQNQYISQLLTGKLTVQVPPQTTAIISIYGVAIIPGLEISKDTKDKDAISIFVGPKPDQ